MQIFIQSAATSSYDVAPDQSVASLKQLISDREGIPAGDQVLTYFGRPLEEGTLEDHEVQPLTHMFLGSRLLGGKVHGSLARAGKVKGQTPKVDAQDKKKQKTGRCKRRQQYNSRFVNVVMQGGRKLGPNSNAQAQ